MHKFKLNNTDNIFMNRGQGILGSETQSISVDAKQECSTEALKGHQG